MSDPTEQVKTYDGSISDMVKSLINSVIKDSQETHGETPLEKIRNELKYNTGGDTLAGITALSSYITARAQERQAVAMESLAKTASKLQMADSLESDGQSIIDQRESKRDYLATTYSLPTHVLSLLWAVRGMLLDASLKSLSKPTQFEPYRRVTTEEIAWTLRMTPEQFLSALPLTSAEYIDYDLLEDFDIYHYSDTDSGPDDWMYGG